jgi:hypothetical protein
MFTEIREKSGTHAYAQYTFSVVVKALCDKPEGRGFET